MNILAFAASNSSTSINRQLVKHAARIINAEIAPDAAIMLLDLNDFEMPIYSSDREEADGIPKHAHSFRKAIEAADAVLVSFAEHNGSYTAAFKNIFDWASRIEGKVWAGKPMVMLATSPGGRGAQTVLETASGAAPHHGAEVKATLSVPSFYDNFDTDKGELSNADLAAQLREALSAFAG